MSKVAELGLQEEFVNEVCQTPIPFEGGFDAVYLWGLINIKPETIADAVVRLIEKQPLESAVAVDTIPPPVENVAVSK